MRSILAFAALVLVFACAGSEDGGAASSPAPSSNDGYSGTGSSSGTPQGPAAAPCSEGGGTALFAEQGVAVHTAIFDGDFIYAVTISDSTKGHQARIVRVAKNGGPVETFLTDGAQLIYPALAVDGDDLYYARSPNLSTSGVYKMPKGGGASTPVEVGYNVAGPFIVDAESIYWGVIESTREEVKIGLWRRPKTGGASERLFASNYRGMLDHGKELYLLDSSLTRFDKTTKETKPLRSDAASTDVIMAAAADATDVIFLNHPKGQLAKVPLTGGSDTVLDTMLTAYGDVAVTADNIYYAHYGNAGELEMSPRSGGASTKLAHVPFPRRVLVDETSIYVAVEFGICRFPR